MYCNGLFDEDDIDNNSGQISTVPVSVFLNFLFAQLSKREDPEEGCHAYNNTELRHMSRLLTRYT
jgi:hypothetical protein